MSPIRCLKGGATSLSGGSRASVGLYVSLRAISSIAIVGICTAYSEALNIHSGAIDVLNVSSAIVISVNQLPV